MNTGSDRRGIILGDRKFFPDRAMIQGPQGELRLEDRAARALGLLCKRRGEVVSREAFIAEVWDGRALSENSVAVVVSDIRKALGDDARCPRLIQTVPKRGYRIPSEVFESDVHAPQNRRARALLAAAGVVALAALVLAMLLPGSSGAPPTTVVTITDVSNVTGLAQYDQAAESISELGAVYLARAGAPVLLRDRWDFSLEDPSRGLYEDFGEMALVFHLFGRILLDEHEPRLVMFATNARTDEVVWSYDSELPDGPRAAYVEAAMEEFLIAIGVTVGSQ